MLLGAPGRPTRCPDATLTLLEVPGLATTLSALVIRLPSGRRVCVCAPCSHRDSVELFLQQGARTPWRASWPTKTARQGGENVPAIVKLLIGCCGPWFVSWWFMYLMLFQEVFRFSGTS